MHTFPLFFRSISDRTTIGLGNLSKSNSDFWTGDWKLTVMDYENPSDFGLFRFSIPPYEVLNEPETLQKGN